MRIAIGTMLWRRHEVFRVWATCIQRLIREFPEHHFDIVVIGSEGRTSKHLVKEYGFHYGECINVTGKKANYRLMAMRNYKPDKYIFCGSDDIISSEAFGYIISQPYDEVASMTLHYFDTRSKRFILSQGYKNTPREGEPLAPWRCLSASVVDALGNPWDERPRNIDSGIYKKLSAIPHTRFYHKGQMIVDIKSPGNITPFFVVCRKDVIELSNDEIYKHFPKEEADAIFRL